MSENEKCPKCGAKSKPDIWESTRGTKTFACGTTFLSTGDVWFWARECQSRQIATLQATVDKLVRGIMDDDTWADDWCPVCHNHPSHDHGGTDCPMRAFDVQVRDV